MKLPPGVDEARVPIASDTDIVTARQRGRALATQLGFTSGDATIVATAISELARNIVLYAKRGEVYVTPVEGREGYGLVITARDEGEGIADVRQAMQDGYSTSGRLGVGLPGVKRLMDEFEIVSEIGKGTTVTVKKWKR
jgi:serine/threonine-protein kinase RsbT